MRQDLSAFREWNRQKSKALIDKRMTEAEAIDLFLLTISLVKRMDITYVGPEV